MISGNCTQLYRIFCFFCSTDMVRKRFTVYTYLQTRSNRSNLRGILAAELSSCQSFLFNFKHDPSTVFEHLGTETILLICPKQRIPHRQNTVTPCFPAIQWGRDTHLNHSKKHQQPSMARLRTSVLSRVDDGGMMLVFVPFQENDVYLL